MFRRFFGRERADRPVSIRTENACDDVFMRGETVRGEGDSLAVGHVFFVHEVEQMIEDARVVHGGLRGSFGDSLSLKSRDEKKPTDRRAVRGEGMFTFG